MPGISVTSLTGGSTTWEIQYAINPNGGPTVSYVEWCDSPSVGVFTNCQFWGESNDGHGTAPVNHDVTITGLTPSSPYSLVVEAINQGGQNYTTHGRFFTGP